MARKKETLPVLLASEVQAAKSAGVRFQGCYRAQKEAERNRDAAFAQLFHKMGFADSEAVRKLDPSALRAAIAKRVGKAFTFENEAAASFALLKTWEGRSPKWRDELVSRLGPAIAAKIESAANTTYSYTLIDPVEDPGPNVIALPAPRIR